MINQLELKKNAKNFSMKWKNRGYEKGESQVFWLSLLNEVLGIDRPQDYLIFEDQVKLDHTSFIDARIPSTNVLIEQKSINKNLRDAIRQSDGTLLSPFQQAKRYSAELPYSERPRWIVISNFKEIHIYDMEKPNGEPEIIQLENLDKEFYRLNFLVDKKDEHIQKELEVSLKAGALVGELYDALLKEYSNPTDEKTLHDLNQLCVRLVFCFYAEDAGLFGRHNQFHDYLYAYKVSNSDFRDKLIKLFNTLNTKISERDPYEDEKLLEFPYVNGGLFESSNLEIPRLNKQIIDIILNQASANFDWSNISPTIFGGVFESTLNPETRRAGGMHYTSIENIHKVIDPLFMNELNEELDLILSDKRVNVRRSKLLDFQSKIASLRFLDPAAGSGNFLTESYIQLRKLENKILKILYGNQIVMELVDNPIKVSISQFCGIEINDFAGTVARTALWIAEAQMFNETKEILHSHVDFFPLKSYPNIVVANSLRIDWNDVIPSKNINYIMGNPPFVGARLMNKEQRNDLTNIFVGFKNIGNLDYVSGWFKKSFDYIKNTNIKCALVSTSSICEGEMIGLLWKNLFSQGIKFNFAYTSFKWNSESKGKAQVHCVIIGFSLIDNENKIIYTDNKFIKAKNINPYLMDGPNIFVERVNKTLSTIPRLHKGCQPTDGGNLIIEADEIDDFIKKEPNAKKYIKKLIGAKEFLNNLDRYCLWLVDVEPSELKKMPLVIDRIKKCKEMRLSAKDKATKKLAEKPHLFRETYNYDQYMVIPKLHTLNRKYIPIGFYGKEVISTDLNYISESRSVYNLGILSSNVHVAWTRTVCGRMGNAIRYSAGVVYNNFPWPTPTEKQKEKIEMTAKNILEARKKYTNSSLADLYDDLLMPPELRKAHQENDKAVMEAYGFDWKNMTESECVAELMKLYLKLKNG